MLDTRCGFARCVWFCCTVATVPTRIVAVWFCLHGCKLSQTYSQHRIVPILCHCVGVSSISTGFVEAFVQDKKDCELRGDRTDAHGVHRRWRPSAIHVSGCCGLSQRIFRCWFSMYNSFPFFFLSFSFPNVMASRTAPLPCFGVYVCNGLCSMDLFSMEIYCKMVFVQLNRTCRCHLASHSHHVNVTSVSVVGYARSLVLLTEASHETL